ncbi:MAG: hypothetical protein ABSB96_11480 [Gaiellaceae bacterium]
MSPFEVGGDSGGWEAGGEEGEEEGDEDAGGGEVGGAGVVVAGGLVPRDLRTTILLRFAALLRLPAASIAAPARTVATMTPGRFNPLTTT